MTTRGNWMAAWAVSLILLAAARADAALVAWWRFEPGALDQDSSGNANHLTNVGVTSGAAAPGVVGGAGSATFSGSHSTFSTTNPLNLTGKDTLTVEWWTRIDAASGFMVFWEHSANYNGSVGAIVSFINDTAGKLDGAERTSNTSNYSIERADAPATGEWVHVAVTFDQTQFGSNHIKLYYDGTQVGGDLVLTTGPQAHDFINDIFHIGSRGNSGAKFVGLIDELRIHDVILAPNQFFIPEPASLGTACGMAALLTLRRRRD